jgi:hypothetical protein
MSFGIGSVMLLFIRRDNPVLNTWQMVVLNMCQRPVKPLPAVTILAPGVLADRLPIFSS